MATKTSNPTGNPKQRRQLIFIAIGGVVLLALAFLQGPKLWKQLNPSDTPTQAQQGSTGATGATGGTTVTAAPAPVLEGSAVVVEPAPRPGAKTTVAGVAVSPWQVPQATTGQLWTFSRLQSKDPFVQQVNPDAQITQVAPFAGSSTTRPAATTPTSPKATSSKAASATVAPTELPPTHATIEVNGNEVRLQLDQRFPPATKVFQLASLKPKSATIVLARGGTIGNGGKVVLTMGEPLTLVNSATDKRYTLKLLYTGSEPEAVQKFSTKAK
jgi:hypothetical protein